MNRNVGCHETTERLKMNHNVGCHENTERLEINHNVGCHETTERLEMNRNDGCHETTERLVINSMNDVTTEQPIDMMVLEDGSLAYASIIDCVSEQNDASQIGVGLVPHQVAIETIVSTEVGSYAIKEEQAMPGAKRKCCSICHSDINPNKDAWRDVYDDYSTYSLNPLSNVLINALQMSNDDVKFFNRVVCIKCFMLIDKFDELEEQLNDIKKQLSALQSELKTKIAQTSTKQNRFSKYDPGAMRVENDSLNIDATNDDKVKFLSNENDDTKNMIICKICNRTGFAGKEELREHCDKVHCEGSWIECNLCTRHIFNGFPGFTEHLANVHPNEILRPGIAVLKYSQKRLKKKSGSKIYLLDKISKKKCQICSICEIPVRRASFKSHMSRVHQEDVVWQCNLCSEKFNKESVLRIHKKEVHNVGVYVEKKHVCHICDKKFLSPYLVRHHIMNIHEKRRNHLCDVCGAGFQYVGTLNIHKRTHTNERPFECKICSKTYRRSTDTRRHILKVHGISFEGRINNPFTFPDCPIAKVSKASMSPEMHQ